MYQKYLNKRGHGGNGDCFHSISHMRGRRNFYYVLNCSFQTIYQTIKVNEPRINITREKGNLLYIIFTIPFDFIPVTAEIELRNNMACYKMKNGAIIHEINLHTVKCGEQERFLTFNVKRNYTTFFSKMDYLYFVFVLMGWSLLPNALRATIS